MVLWLGTAVDDSHRGTPEADRLEGLGGNDRLWGEGGDDTILGGAGDDRLWGGAGFDVLSGDVGNDGLAGGLGDDSLRGGPGDDRLDGDAGNDRLWGDPGRDVLAGGAGNDWLSGGPGNDTLDGGTGQDTLYGGDGNDTFLRIDPGEEVDGGAGDDLMVVDFGPIYLPDLPPDKALGFLKGGDGFDTVRVINTAFSFNYPALDATIPSPIFIWAGGNPEELDNPTPVLFVGANAEVWSDNPQGAFYYFTGIERIEIVADAERRVQYDGDRSSLEPLTIITGDANDALSASLWQEVLDGGKGDDTFYIGPDTQQGDRYVSRPDDADLFYFSGPIMGRMTLTGFNGQGAAGGDVIRFQDIAPGTFTVTENADGTTLISWAEEAELLVDAVGLVRGVDYFV